MSRILIRIIKKILENKRLLCILLLIISIICAYISIVKIENVIFLVIYIILLFLMLANYFVYRKIYKVIDVFDSKCKVRNVDYLFIGDICNYYERVNKGNEKKTYVELVAPNRNIVSSFEILRHTFSILDESNGKVVIFVKGKNINKTNYSIFDIPVFLMSPTSLVRLKLAGMRRKSFVPIIIEPYKSIKYLASNFVKNKTRDMDICVINNESIEEFCNERGLKVEIWTEQ